MDEYATVIDIVTEIIEEDPPLLYDLTALQIEANRLFGLSAAETLKCAQSLYEADLLTYPRTSSHYITPDMEQSVSSLASGSESNVSENTNLSSTGSNGTGNAASSGAEGTMGGGSSENGNEFDENKNYKPDPEAPAIYKRELGDNEFITGVSDLADVNEAAATEESLSVDHLSPEESDAELVGENYEKELYEEQGEIAKTAFNSADSISEKDRYGNDYKPLALNEARDLSDKLKTQINNVPNGKRGNYRVPEPEKIKGVSVNANGEARIIERWKDGTDGAQSGSRHMEVVKAIGENGKPTVIDRIGGENGNYFSPLSSQGEPFSLKERATGDYLPNPNIKENDSYHQYEIKRDFTRENFEKAIDATYDDSDEKEDKKDRLNAYYKDAVSDSYTNGHDGEKYSDLSADKVDGIKTGIIDQMFLKDGDQYGKGTDGGGIQFITPFNVKELKEMGMIEEILKRR